MKNLLLKSILLISHREKAAKKITLDPHVNVIKGANDTGKSSLIKSIYRTFGATPHKIHHKWKQAEVASLIKFEVDGVLYSIYRHRDSYSLFDSANLLIGTYSSVTNELAPALASLFDFKLKLLNRDGESITPPPAYLFLPFYIDQDQGWTSTWGSFSQLQQLPNWKKSLIGYHMGIRPDRWYELDSKKRNILAKQDEPQRELKALKHLLTTTREQVSRSDFDIDVSVFKSEIKSLLDECNALRIEEHKFRQQLVNLQTEKIKLEAQIEIVAKTHDELSDDYTFATEINSEFVGCPTCGAEYSNSFSERFDIAKDTQTCVDLLTSLRNDMSDTNKKIERTEESLSKFREKQSRINNLLASKQGKVKLKDLVQLEGRRTLVSHLNNEIKKYQNALTMLNDEADAISSEMSRIDSPDRRRKITSQYAEHLRQNSMLLSVTSLSDKVFKSIYATIEESGSDMPRAVLAYYFAVLQAIKSNGNSTFCPMIIDAPNQQEQDRTNLEKIMNFISSHRFKDQQLILGLVDDAGVSLPGKTILLETKYSLLSRQDYPEVAEEIRYFESMNLSLDVM